MALSDQFLQEIINRDPHLGLLLGQMIDGINSTAANAAVGVLEKLPAPATLASVNVTWNKAGVYQITHQTSQPPNIGAHYFSEIDTSPSFPAPIVIDHGASRSSEPKVLPNGTYYIRGYHQYPGSLPSTPVNYGGSTPAPIAIAGGSDLTLLPSTGSGTSPENGQRGGTGFGISQVQPPNSQLTLASIPSSGGGGGGGGGTSFAVITSGDNTQAAMTVDTGASLGFSGSGVVNASEINGVPFNNTDPALGKIPIAQGDGTATWADPLVQGVSSVGTAVSGINPVLVGAEDNSSNLANLNVDSSGNLKVNVAAGGGGNSAAGPTGSAVPTDADYVGFNSSGDLVGVSSTNPLPIAGAVTQGTAASLNATVVGTGTFVVQDSSDMTGTVPGTAPSKTGVVGGIYNSSAPSPTTGQTLPVQLDSSGNLKVNVAAGSSGNAAASATGATVPVDAGYTGFDSGGDLVGVSSTNPLPSTDKADGTVGSATPSTAITIGGTDGTDLRVISTQVGGAVKVMPASTIKSLNLGTTTGTDCIWTVTSGKRWRVISISFAFVTSATAGARGIGFIWQDATPVTCGIAGYFITIPASTTAFVSATPGVPPQSNFLAGLTSLTVSLPPYLVLGPGMKIQTYTNNLQAGDEFEGPDLLYEEFSDT